MKGGNIILRKLKNSKGFTTAELLAGLLLMGMLSSLIVITNQMLGTIAFEASGLSKQQLLSNAIVNSLISEVRNADNISIRTAPYSYDGGTHQTAGFVYDSSRFDYFQADITRTFREVIFVNSNDGKVYVGRAEDSYSLTGTVSTYVEDPKLLVGDGTYSDCIVSLSTSSESTGVIYPTGLSTSDVIDEATFKLVVSVTDSTSGVSTDSTITVNTNIFSG